MLGNPPQMLIQLYQKLHRGQWCPDFQKSFSFLNCNQPQKLWEAGVQRKRILEKTDKESSH
jgi:hypothetical protein